jgi:hypothetical protein
MKRLKNSNCSEQKLKKKSKKVEFIYEKLKNSYYQRRIREIAATTFASDWRICPKGILLWKSVGTSFVNGRE